MKIALYAAVAVITYLIGGISIANVLSRKLIDQNITEVGSGNAGASNVIRNCGWAAGFLTLAFDAAKAAASVFIAQWLGGLIVGPGAGEIAGYIAAVCVTVGHIWPVFSGFKGGKGVACTLGAMLYLMPVYTLIVVAVVAVVTLIFKTMSITSIVGITLMVIIAFIRFPVSNPENIPFVVTVCIMFLIVILTHRANIARLIKGEEAKVSIKNKNGKQD